MQGPSAIATSSKNEKPYALRDPCLWVSSYTPGAWCVPCIWGRAFPVSLPEWETIYVQSRNHSPASPVWWFCRYMLPDRLKNLQLFEQLSFSSRCRLLVSSTFTTFIRLWTKEKSTKRNFSSFGAVSSLTEHRLHLVSVNWKGRSFGEPLKSLIRKGILPALLDPRKKSPVVYLVLHPSLFGLTCLEPVKAAGSSWTTPNYLLWFDFCNEMLALKILRRLRYWHLVGTCNMAPFASW